MNDVRPMNGFCRLSERRDHDRKIRALIALIMKIKEGTDGRRRVGGRRKMKS